MKIQAYGDKALVYMFNRILEFKPEKCRPTGKVRQIKDKFLVEFTTP